MLLALIVLLAPATGQAAEAKALLWRIERAGFEPGHLFGTMHVSEPDIVAISPAVRAALLDADMLVGEGVPSEAFEAAVIAEVARTPPYLRAEVALNRRLLEGIIAAGVCYGLAEVETRMLPIWMLVTMFVLMTPAQVEQERQRHLDGTRILDQELAHIALKAGKFVLWIESPGQSIGFFKDMPHDDLMGLLRQVARDPSCPPDVEVDPVVDLYRARDLDGMLAMIDEALTQVEDPELWRRLWRRLLPQRNHGMVERIEALAQASRLFVAVGAAHLPGEEGVIALLRQRGWTVEAVE